MDTLPTTILTTSSGDVEVTPSDITVIHVIDGQRGAFAVADVDGRDVYISANVTARFNLQGGERASALLIPNTSQPDKTHWFCRMIVQGVNARTADQDRRVVWSTIAAGGVWKVSDLADEVRRHDPTATEISSELRAYVAAEAGYRDGLFAKFLLCLPGAEKRDWRQTWYTARPDRADVDEWDTEEEASDNG